uniref:tRNA pseudouridine synthase n=1 Tax=Calcidiscus leptoporus TaxID=127549 RepID=A0A7S0J8D0_9EUKA
MYGAEVLLHAASRTDAGVHARGQVCIFDHAGRREHDLSKLRYSMNQLLPEDTCVREAASVPDSFDPRTNLGKEYIYRLNTSASRDPLRRLYEWHVPERRGQQWDTDAVRRGAALLQSDTARDFSAFANMPRGAERTRRIDPFCTLRELRVVQTSSSLVSIHLSADRFLYKMARNMVGALVSVGFCELGVCELELALDSGRFSHTNSPGLTAPAQGLVLDRVFYGEDEPFKGHLDLARLGKS